MIFGDVDMTEQPTHSHAIFRIPKQLGFMRVTLMAYSFVILEKDLEKGLIHFWVGGWSINSLIKKLVFNFKILIKINCSICS